MQNCINSTTRITAGTTVGLLVLSLLSFSLACNKGEVIEEVGDTTVSTKDYEDYYATYLEKAVRITNLEKRTLSRWLCSPDQIPPDPAIRDLVDKMNPQVNYKVYRDQLVIEQVARNEGFADRPVIRQILDQVMRDTLVQLYMQEKMDKRIQVSDDQKNAKCDELRKKYPDRVGPLPLDRCLEIAESILKNEIIQKEGPRMVEEIKENVSIHRNPNFNRDDYLDNKLGIYQTMRKEGGCDSSSSAVPPSNTPAPANGPGPGQGATPQPAPHR